MPLGHVGLFTNDIDKMSNFYLSALKPLGYALFKSFQNNTVRGYAARGCGPDFWLAATDAPRGASQTPEVEQALEQVTGKPTGQLHLAFEAKTRAQVRAFHNAALEAGAICNGPPGPRPEYFFTYYAAFVIDPEGHNIEAVCMRPAFWAEDWDWKVWTGLVGLTGIAAAAIFTRL